ncbi:MAG: hypothetical protein ACLFUI_06410 [Halanaerobiales bacterium]
MSNWKSVLNDDPIDWLLESNPWTRHMTLIELLGEPKGSEKASIARKDLKEHPLVSKLLKDTEEWFISPSMRHDDSKMPHYKLKMLADFGFTKSDEDIKRIIEVVTQHTDNNLYAIKQSPPQKVKSDKEKKESKEWHALPCDSPLISTTLYRLGDRSKELEETIDIIKDKWMNETGWFCNLFFVKSQYKKHQIGCMMAGLQALELFSLVPDMEEKPIQNALHPLKFHRKYGKSLYYFGRSKRFWSFKYPFVWYNALYLAEVLTRFEFLKDEELLREIIDWIIDSQDDKGRFGPTSMFRHYSKWDFANKKEVSPWITYLCCKILKRYYN